MASAIDLLPTPTGSPPPKPRLESLSTEINIATRKQHTELNRLIIDRIPLALPPHASDLSLYGLGLAAFARIYVAFESELDTIERRVAASTDSPDVKLHRSEVDKWLATLRPKGLARSHRMSEDILGLQTDLKLPQDIIHENIRFKQRIHELAEAKPHALVAYTWVMYMAIFSGGRWIRQQLANAGPEFWASQGYVSVYPQTPLSMTGFLFLSFDGDQDGEELKVEYKARLAEADTVLTPSERQDVLDAARELFEICIDVVKELDVAAAKQATRERSWPIVELVLAFILLPALYWYWSTLRR